MNNVALASLLWQSSHWFDVLLLISGMHYESFLRLLCYLSKDYIWKICKLYLVVGNLWNVYWFRRIPGKILFSLIAMSGDFHGNRSLHRNLYQSVYVEKTDQKNWETLLIFCCPYHIFRFGEGRLLKHLLILARFRKGLWRIRLRRVLLKGTGSSNFCCASKGRFPRTKVFSHQAATEYVILPDSVI